MTELSQQTSATPSNTQYINVVGFNIVIHGKGAHAARPHEGIDAIVIASHIVTALQTLPNRVLNVMESVVIRVTRF